MLSLKERIELLGHDLKATPLRISMSSDLPFAIFRYEPEREWQMRRELGRLKTRIEKTGKHVTIISLADILWKTIVDTEGISAIVELEKEAGFQAAQEQVGLYLSDEDFCPLPRTLAELLARLDPAKLVFRGLKIGFLGL